MHKRRGRSAKFFSAGLLASEAGITAQGMRDWLARHGVEPDVIGVNQRRPVPYYSAATRRRIFQIRQEAREAKVGQSQSAA